MTMRTVLNKDKLANAPSPFIAHIRHQPWRFFAIQKPEGKDVTASNQRWDIHKIGHEECSKKFDGIVSASDGISGKIPPLRKFRPSAFKIHVAFTVLVLTLFINQFFLT